MAALRCLWQMARPTTAELDDYLVGAGLATSGQYDNDQLKRFLDVAEAEFLSQTDWSPYEATASQTRTYMVAAPTRRWWNPDTGMLTITALQIDDVTYDQGTHWDFAEPERTSHLSLTFGNYWAEGKLEITGTFGCAASYPADVLAALLAKASLTMLDETKGAYGGVSSIKQGPVTISFAESDTLDAMANMRTIFDRAVVRHRRPA